MARTRTRFPRRRRWLLSITVALIVSGVGLWTFLARQDYGGQTHAQVAEGHRAPAFTLPSSTGDAVTLASYLGHQPVVLVFYMGDF